jgi:hypothetical protein
VSNALVDTALKKGFKLSLLGLFLITLPGIIKLNPFIGTIFLFLGLILITKGLLNHKRLKNLQLKPYKLMISENKLDFFKGDKHLATFLLSEIKELLFIEKEGFGIRGKTFKNETFFFPYFKESQLKEIRDFMSDSSSYET